MFSGHALVYLLVALMWNRYCNKWERLIVWILMLAATVSLIATRMHYTDDVLVATYVIFTMYWIYHITVETPEWRQQCVIIRWLEPDDDVCIKPAEKTFLYEPIGDESVV
jgi:hypothetical protein